MKTLLILFAIALMLSFIAYRFADPILTIVAVSCTEWIGIVLLIAALSNKKLPKE